MKKSNLALVQPAPDEEPDRDLPDHPTDVASDQITEAGSALNRDARHFLQMPWPTLGGLVGGVAKGEIWFVGAFSGHGKTTFLTSALDEWYKGGKRIYYMGLESRPWILRTHWAAKRLNLDAGDVLSGKAAAEWQDWPEHKERLRKELFAQLHGDSAERVYFAPEPFINLKRLRNACEQAASLNSDVMIIDHIDHIESEGKRSGIDESKAVIKGLLTLAQEYELRMLVATQFNNEALKQNRIALYQPPQPQYVYMGSHKRQVASGMIGLYRPLKFSGVDPDALSRFRNGDGEPMDVIEQNTMGVTVMKHRLYGNREGKRGFLGVERGRVVELSEADKGITQI